MSNSLSALIVEKSLIKNITQHEVQGTWSAGTAKFKLENVTVPESAFLGEKNNAFSM